MSDPLKLGSGMFNIIINIINIINIFLKKYYYYRKNHKFYLKGKIRNYYYC
jgi:hypothetical protein